MKISLILFWLLCFSFAYGQQKYTLRGSLCDTTGQAVSGSVLVLMTRADSVQLKLEYCQNGAFELTWTDSLAQEVMLYVSAIGYNGRYVDVDKSLPDLGRIVLTPLSVYMDEVTVAARKPIGHKFERSRDEYTIPEWLGERSYDVNSLLAMIPGLAVNGDKIEIAGIGKPTYLINGLLPRGGELENLNPKDIDKVTIIRMPGAKYDMNVVGLISIETKKQWYDYLSVRMKDDFQYTNEAFNKASASINFRKDKMTHSLNYTHTYAPERYRSWDSYETTIPEEDIHYLLVSDMKMYERTNTHNFLYTPKWQIDNHSFVDLQYMFSARSFADDYLSRIEFSDETDLNLRTGSLTDAGSKNHFGILRYDNTFGSERKKRLTLNVVYMKFSENNDVDVIEESLTSDLPIDTNFIAYRQKYKNEVFSLTVDYEFSLWNDLKVETGGSYGNLWTNSDMEYLSEISSTRNYDRSEQAAFYLNADHVIGKFGYQVGVRGQYEYRHDKKEHAFYFLPSLGFSWRWNDALNLIFYYRRTTQYPTTQQLNTNVSYFHKYLYSGGNPDLAPTVVNSFLSRLALPSGLALTCNYLNKKDDIIICTLKDPDDPEKLALTLDNIAKANDLSVSLSWNRTYGFYYLNLNAGYSQYFAKSPLLDQDTRFRPQFTVGATHSFTISPNIQAAIYMNYQTAYYRYNVYVRRRYSVSPQLTFNLLKKRLNIKIEGKDLLNGGNHYTKDKYGHTLTITESDYHPRGITIGISYNFNNFMDLFQKNEAGSEMIKRAGVED